MSTPRHSNESLATRKRAMPVAMHPASYCAAQGVSRRGTAIETVSSSITRKGTRRNVGHGVRSEGKISGWLDSIRYEFCVPCGKAVVSTLARVCRERANHRLLPLDENLRLSIERYQSPARCTVKEPRRTNPTWESASKKQWKNWL